MSTEITNKKKDPPVSSAAVVHVLPFPVDNVRVAVHEGDLCKQCGGMRM
jgi:hypothetical protein